MTWIEPGLKVTSDFVWGPLMIALAALSPIIFRITREYFA